MIKPRIDILSHSIRVSQFDARVRDELKAYCGHHLAEWTFKWDYMSRKHKSVIKCVYAGVHSNRRVFYFHKSQLNDILNIFSSCGYLSNSIELVERPMYNPDQIEWIPNPKDDRILREHQHTLIDYLMSTTPAHITASRLVTAQTGFGKGVVAMKTMERLHARTLLLIKPMYIKKWVDEIHQTFIMNKGEILVIQGSDKLSNLLQMEDHEIAKIKVIIMAIPTYRNYIKYWEEQNGEGYQQYKINPINFCEHFKIGMKLIDESHQEFHLIYRSELYTHVPLSVAMSATMVSDQAFLNRMYEVIWPIPYRAPHIENKKYILVRHVWYDTYPNLSDDRFKTHMGYSHIKFEQWLMQSSQRQVAFVSMLVDLLKNTFLKHYEEGQKAVIFCATQDLCTYVSEQLAYEFKDKNVRRYIQGDDYHECLIKPDLTITTLKSAGTAVDIPDLVMCFCTVAVSSQQANQQVIGRLREIKRWPNIRPEFYFLSCRQIKKHQQYARDKQNKLHDKVLRFEQTNFHYRVQ